ncbi:MAG: hypothetical protein WCF85_21925, partial [Rhodospirillaceae bacterium]
MGELRGQPLLNLLEREIALHSRHIAATLAPFDPTSASMAWMEALRSVEEFINLPLFGLDDPSLERALVTLPVANCLAHPRRLRAVRHFIAYRYGEAFAQRFTTLLTQAAAIAMAFAHNGRMEAASGFETVAHAVGYFQSRRRHLVSLLYTMPDACCGGHAVPPIDVLNNFLPLVELHGIALTGLYQQRMLAEAFDDHALLLNGNDYRGIREYPALDAFFLVLQWHFLNSGNLPLDMAP